MICPRCGHVDPTIPVPEFTPKGKRRKVGTCSDCGTEAWAVGTQRFSERSQEHTVRDGEAREVLIANVWRDHLNKVRGGGFEHRDRATADDVDREMLQHGELHHFFEIKERTCSLNAYRLTKFPYAKITAARTLHAETGKPVMFLLKFTDAWAYFHFDPTVEYARGDRPFAPNYRPEQQWRQRQVPVEINVETLRVLPMSLTVYA